MRVGTAAGACVVAPAAGWTSLHRRGAHAGRSHKYDWNGRQSVYAVQLSASPTYIYTVENE